MNIKTFVVPVEHLDDATLGYRSSVMKVLASEFYTGYNLERMCRLVCEIK